MAAEKADGAHAVATLASLTAHFTTHKSDLYGGVCAVVAVTGSADETGNLLSVALQNHVFEWELPETLVVLTASGVTVVASEKKAVFLGPVEDAAGGSGAFTILRRAAKKEERDAVDAAIFGRARAVLESAAHGGRVTVGTLSGDIAATSFTRAWQSAFDSWGFGTVDVSNGVAAAIRLSTEEEQASVRAAGTVSKVLVAQKVKARMRSLIAKGRSAEHSSIAKGIQKCVEDKLSDVRVPRELDADLVDLAITPSIQSGGKFSLNYLSASAIENKGRLSSEGVVLSILAARYKTMVALVGRTYIVDPTKEQESQYERLLEAFSALRDGLRAGATISAVVRAALDVVDRAPSMRSKLASSDFGHATGLRLHDPSLVLSASSTSVVEAPCAYVVSIGFTGLTDSSGKKYAMLLADTVLVKEDMTENVTTQELDLGSIAFVSQKSESESESEASGEEGGSDDDGAQRQAKVAENGTAGRVGGRSARLASLAKEAGMSAHDELTKRAQKQKELLRRRVEEARGALGGGERGGGGGGDGGGRGRGGARAPLGTYHDIVSYKSMAALPGDLGASRNKLYVDKDNKTVLVPVNGSHMAIHIMAIKSVTKLEEGSVAFLRFNLYTPTGLAKDAPPEVVDVCRASPNAMFIKTLTFRSMDVSHIEKIHRLLNSVRADLRASVAQRRELADLVEQAHLLESPAPPRLSGLEMRPKISGGKTSGVLAAHRNGLRFTSNKGERVDMLYSNIRHAILQKCVKEHIVLLHFNLRHPIMIGKKKHANITVFTEVVEASQTLESRASGYDRDEVEAERKERELRKKLNSAFEQFAQSVQACAEKDADAKFFRGIEEPYREVGFLGVAFKENVFIAPCPYCLISVTDAPALVVSIEDILHVHFQRVTFGTKTFDMVIIFKEGVKKPDEDQFHVINSIPMKSLDTIKTWLTDVVGTTYTEGAQEMNWRAAIEEYVRHDEFWESEVDEETGRHLVGFEKLVPATSDVEGEGSEDDAESAYEESESEADASEASSDGSDWGDVVDEDEESGASEASEESGGEDWEELEKKAEAHDRKRAVAEAELEAHDRARKKPRKGK